MSARATLFGALALILGAGTACKKNGGGGFDGSGLEDLTPAQGFFYRIPPFEIPAGEETQDCFFVTVPDIAAGQPIRVNRIRTGMNPGSHHFNVFRVNTIKNLDGAPGSVVRGGECWKASNWSDWPLVVNTQQSDPDDPFYEWLLPEGVAHVFQPGEKLMLQVHYVNASTQPAPYGGEAAINFYRTTDAAAVELGTLFATQQSIRVCASNPTPKYAGTCSFGSGAGQVHIAAANGHFHSRGEELQMFEWDGLTAAEPALTERFYRSTSWDHPPMATGLDVTPPVQGGIWWTCEYEWKEPSGGCDELNTLDPAQANDCCYVFGPEVESGEHCNVFVYYWPKSPSAGDIFCN